MSWKGPEISAGFGFQRKYNSKSKSVCPRDLFNYFKFDHLHILLKFRYIIFNLEWPRWNPWTWSLLYRLQLRLMNKHNRTN